MDALAVSNAETASTCGERCVPVDDAPGGSNARPVSTTARRLPRPRRGQWEDHMKTFAYASDAHRATANGARCKASGPQPWRRRQGGPALGLRGNAPASRSAPSRLESLLWGLVYGGLLSLLGWGLLLRWLLL